MGKTYGHLTDEQVHRLFDVAHELMVEASEQDSGYLRDVLLDYVNRLEACELIDSISDDEENVASQLGFWPDTGKEYEEDEDDGD